MIEEQETPRILCDLVAFEFDGIPVSELVKELMAQKGERIWYPGGMLFTLDDDDETPVLKGWFTPAVLNDGSYTSDPDSGEETPLYMAGQTRHALFYYVDDEWQLQSEVDNA